MSSYVANIPIYYHFICLSRFSSFVFIGPFPHIHFTYLVAHSGLSA